MSASFNHNINEGIRQFFTVEMLAEIEATFNMVCDQQGIMPYYKIPIALQALGMSLSDFSGDVNSYQSDEIDCDKFMTIVMECVKYPNWAVNEISESFKLFDKDGNGYVDPGEVRKILTRVGEIINESDIKEQLKEFDIDGDNEMVLTEYNKMIAATKGSDFAFEDSTYTHP